MSEICDMEPFLYDAAPIDPAPRAAAGEEGDQTFLSEPASAASSEQVNQQQLEGYLNRLREALCADITALEARLTALETP